RIRKAWERRSLGMRKLVARTDHIARPADRMQERRLETLVDLGTEARNMHVDDICLGVEMILPDAFEQHGAGHHLACVAHQMSEKPEFARLPVNGSHTAIGRAGQKIEFEFANL